MTVDKTKARATNQNEIVEGTRDTIILEHTDLQITSHQSRKPPGMEGKVHGMWKTRAPDGTELSS